jgi:hypothetical protein
LVSKVALSPIFADFERQLAAEGLAPLDAGRMVTRGARNHHADWERTMPERAAAADAYLAWAWSVVEQLGARGFESDRQRKVWLLHADGLSHNEIARRLSMRRRTVTAEVSAVKVAYGPAPPNPWRKSGRETQMGKGEVAAIRTDQPPAPPKVFRYARILMREPLEIKGRATRHDRLLDVDGRPHAGGIDVMIGPEDFPGTAVEPQVITVPWWRIRQADRTVDG